MFFVPSIPSTGTNFITNLLTGGDDKKVTSLKKILSGKKEQGTVCREHFGLTWLSIHTLIDYGKVTKTIIPMRDPGLVLCSWIDREIGNIKRRMQGWRDLIQFDAEVNVQYVPVDLPNYRQDALNKLKLDLSTDWKPVNSWGEYKLRESYLLGKEPRTPYWSQLKELEPSLRPILERMGYKKLLWWSN